jgi:hypothetical protein
VDDHQRGIGRLTVEPRAVPEVERPRARPDPGVDVGPVPDRDDAPVGHRERFGGGLCVVDGANGSPNDQVSDGHAVIRSSGQATKKNLMNSSDGVDF